MAEGKDDCPWRKFTPEELEKHLSPTKWARRAKAADQIIQDHIDALDKASHKSRESVQFERIIYGPGEEQKIDVFGTESLPKDAPILVYIHGGYWQALSLEMSAHLAKVFHDAGVMVASIGYDLCPYVTFEELIEQVKQAFIRVLRIAQERGSRGVYVTGHSAGGHLTGLVMATDWSEYGMDNSIIKGGAPLSPLFDLRPFCGISDNKAVKLTEERAWKYSPWRMIDELVRLNKSRKVRLVAGEYDPPEFLRQTEDMYKVLASHGLDVTFYTAPALDHFEVTEQLEDPVYEGTKILMKMMDIQ